MLWYPHLATMRKNWLNWGWTNWTEDKQTELRMHWPWTKNVSWWCGAGNIRYLTGNRSSLWGSHLWRLNLPRHDLLWTDLWRLNLPRHDLLWTDLCRLNLPRHDLLWTDLCPWRWRGTRRRPASRCPAGPRCRYRPCPAECWTGVRRPVCSSPARSRRSPGPWPKPADRDAEGVKYFNFQSVFSHSMEQCVCCRDVASCRPTRT